MKKKNMIKRNLCFLFLIFQLGSTSCSSDSQKTKIRIVNLQGKPKPVLTRVPDYNAKFLDGQQLENRNTPNASVEQQATTIFPETRTNPDQIYSQKIEETYNSNLANKKNTNLDNLNNSPEKTNMIFAGRSNNQENIEYNLANSKDEVDEILLNSNKNSKVNKVTQNKIKENKNLNSSKTYFVQTGSYVSQEVANEELTLMKKFHKGKIEKVNIDDNRITYRVLLGPFTNKAQARKLVNRIVNSGHEAILVKN